MPSVSWVSLSHKAPTWSSSPMRSTGRLEYSTLYSVMNQSSYAVCEEITEWPCHKPRSTARLINMHLTLKAGKAPGRAWPLPEQAALVYSCPRCEPSLVEGQDQTRSTETNLPSKINGRIYAKTFFWKRSPFCFNNAGKYIGADPFYVPLLMN